MKTACCNKTELWLKVFEEAQKIATYRIN